MEQKESFLLPAAILIAGALLAIAIFIVRSGSPVSPLEYVSAIRPVSPEDHIVGNPDAPVIIVEYSDVDCAYCKDFQATLTQLMTEYAATGQVAWVYRHFPVINLHQYAASHAEAAECVALQGGDALFFRFIDTLQQSTPGNDEFSPTGYASVVEGLGLSVSEFEACRSSDKTVERVTLDFENAVAAGGEGTPYTVILIDGAESIPITGALPYDAMKEVIEQAISKVK
jgi:protein-disulfide isomerase